MPKIQKEININPLEKVSYSKLSYSEIVNEIIAAIKKHPLYKTDWEDFLDSNAGKMLIDVFSFLATKIILRLDLIVNELFLTTAVDPKAILNILKLIDYKISPPTASEVNLSFEFIHPTPIVETTFEISKLLDIFTLSAVDLDGNETKFEIIGKKQDGSYDYLFEEYPDNAITIKYTPGMSTIYPIKAYSGITYLERDVVVDKPENFTYTLPFYPVIDDSIKVYLVKDNGILIELQRVDNFLQVVAEELIYPVYIVEYDNYYCATIKFGTAHLGGSFENIIPNIPETYEKLQIYYRVGGGSKTNIVRNAINTTHVLGGAYRVRIYNPEPAVGGSDGENLEEARVIAPFYVKTLDRAVTPEDYITVLKKQNKVKLWYSMIKTPEENYDKIPYLFCYIYTSPERNFDKFVFENEVINQNEINFSIPIIDNFTSVENYVAAFNLRLNNFLNLRGFYSFSSKYIDGNYYYYGNDNSIYYPRIQGYEIGSEAEVLYQYLQTKKIIGIENVFRWTVFSPIKIVLRMYYMRGHSKEEAIKRVLGLLYAYLSPGSVEIGYGKPIIISKLYNYLSFIPGVSYIEVENLYRINEHTVSRPPSPSKNLNLYPSENEICFIYPIKYLYKLPENIQSIYAAEIIAEKE